MLNIAIVAGGNSGEYEISMNSGLQVELHMDLNRFHPYLIEIRGNEWIYRVEETSFPVDKNDFTLTVGKRRIRFDAVFNAIHGTPGEDGKLQGYFDMLGIPYTSSGVTTSSLSFNKNFCKQAVTSFGYTTARSVHLHRSTPDGETIIRRNLAPPLFIKPNNGGSSVGMSKVKYKKDLKQALEKAFREDEEVLAEEFISGRELTCGVLRTGGKVLSLPVTEIIPKKEFFDYEAKYSPGMADEVVPAKVPYRISKKCREISEDLYVRLNCRGVVRFDYIFDGSKFFFLEVNTVPGLTSGSIVPKMARAQGWTYTELITRLLEEIVG